MKLIKGNAGQPLIKYRANRRNWTVEAVTDNVTVYTHFEKKSEAIEWMDKFKKDGRFL